MDLNLQKKYIIFVVIVAIIFIGYFFINKSGIWQRGGLSEGERTNLLNNLKSDSSKSISEEERLKIMESLSKSKK